MRPLRALLLYLCAVFGLGPLLAPWLYWAGQAVGHAIPLLSDLAKAPFHTYVKQSLKLVALAGLWPFLRSLGVRSWNGVGVVRPAGQWPKLGAGIVMGFVPLGLVTAAALVSGAAQFDGGVAGKWWGKLPGFAVAACFIAVGEELLFRGALFGSLRRVHAWPMALALSSAAYAFLHFFQKAKYAGAVTWTSGLELLPRMMAGFGNLKLFVPGFFVLAMAGAILAWAYQRTGNLYLSVGLHAGWVFWLRSYAAITDPVPGAAAWFWGTGKLYDGWLAFAALFVTLLVLRPLAGARAVPSDVHAFAK